jgi:drug/metabolite transporter (DMT)-like permease
VWIETNPARIIIKLSKEKMSIVQISLILFTVFLLSVGQILFKLASSDINLSSSGLIPSLISARLAIAFLVYSFATVLWLIALKDLPLRVAYPFAALAFFIVPTLAHFLLGETLSWNTYVGAGIIALGVIVSTFK